MYSFVNSNTLNLKREVIGNKRIKVLEKFIEPHSINDENKD